jgi:hypothetical protein
MQNTISNKLDKMLLDPKARGFLNHLIHAYFPMTNVSKVMDKPRGVPFRCVLTNDNLVSVQEILDGISSDAFKDSFLEFLKSFTLDKPEEVTPMESLMGEKKLGFSGKDTTTYLSSNSLRDLYNWIFEKVLTGDKHITWMVKSLNKDKSPAKPRFDSRPPREKIPEIIPAKFMLGELDIFKKLKDLVYY